MSILTEREWEAAKPYSTDKVSVKKLRIDEANAGFDIWGRPKNQPVEISVVLALSQPFSSAAATDTVNESTVHYGKLSKAVIAMVDKSKSQWKSAEEFVQDVVLSAMTAASDKSVVSAIQVDACFTKACRNGSGISIHLSYIPSTSQTSIVMHLRKMWFSALIGVNSNERTMKQRVIVSVWIDGVDKTFTDSCFEAEQIVEKIIEESSFETLESLAEELASSMIKYYIVIKQQVLGCPTPAGVRIKIEKPSAVPRAEAPAVEIYRSVEATRGDKRKMSEAGSKVLLVPFPLQGRLDEVLSSWKQD